MGLAFRVFLLLPTGKGKDEDEYVSTGSCLCHVFCFEYTR